ncbi:MAG: MFS transporter [Anaerolineales bacterium]
MLQRIRNTYNEYPKTFWILMLGSFIDRLGGSLLFPYFALYITERFNVGMIQVGYLFAIFSGTSIVGGILGGALTDKFGRRAMLLFGLIFSGLSTLLMGYIGSISVFYGLAAFVGLLSNAGGPAQQAMISDLLPEDKRTSGFAMHRVIFNLAVTIGPALGGLIAARSYFLLFVFDAIISLVVAAIVFVGIPETKPALKEGQVEETVVQSVGGYRHILRDGLFMAFLVISIIVTLVYVQMNSTLGVFLRDTHGITPLYYGYILSLNAGMVVAFQFWITRRVKGWAPMVLMAVGTLLYAIGFGMYAFGSTLLWFAFAMVVITVGEMVLAPEGTALVARFAPEHMRGRYMGMFGFTWGIAFAVGPLAAGFIIENYDPRWVWYVAFILGMVGTLGYLVLHAATQKRFSKIKAEPVHLG